MALGQSMLHVSRPLTDLVVSYDPATDGYFRNWLLPRKPVTKLANQIRQISKQDLLRLYDLKVGSDGNVHEVRFQTDTTLSYSAQPYAAQAILDYLDMENADEELQYEQEMARAANLSLSQTLEYVAVNQTLRSTSVLTNNKTLSGGTLWDNYTSSTSSPLDDLISACQIIRMKTGKNVNRIGMSEITWNVLAQHPNVISRMPVHTTPSGAGTLTPELLEKILRVEPGSVRVSAATYTAAAQGATPTFKSFIGSDVIVARAEDPSIRTFGLGHEFAFSGFGSDAFAVLKYPLPQRGVMGADALKVVGIVDFKVTNPDAAFLIKTTLNTASSAYGGFVD